MGRNEVIDGMEPFENGECRLWPLDPPPFRMPFDTECAEEAADDDDGEGAVSDWW